MASFMTEELSSESMMVAMADLNDFSNLSRALRRAIQDWMGETGPIPEVLYGGACIRFRREDWMGSLRSLDA